VVEETSLPIFQLIVPGKRFCATVAGEIIPFGPRNGVGSVVEVVVSSVVLVVVLEPFAAETDAATRRTSPSVPLASARLRYGRFLDL
jgi:hypothetical protein